MSSPGGALWDEGLSQRSQPAPLLQSWAWGEVQAQAGWQVERLHLPGGGMASVQLRGRRAGRWAYVPRGPLPAGVLPELAAWAQSRRLARLRVEPEAPAELRPALVELGFRPAPPVQPQHTVIVELRPEADLLASFRAETRRNIRLAERRGVSVAEGAEAEELARQAALTAARQGINLPAAEYYRLLLDTLPFCRTYVARHDGTALAAILVAHFDRRAYYLYGGSSAARPDLKASHAVQWAAMRSAVARGCRDYDLWGIPPRSDPGHPWHGLWQFKTGFQGRHFEYAGSFQLDFGWGARLLDAQEGARRAVRRLRARR